MAKDCVLWKLVYLAWNEQKPNLKCMWGVVDAVDAEAVVEGQAWCTWGEQRQLQAFTRRLRRAGLAHQAVCSQLLHENMTALFLQLQVARGRQGLLSYCQHLLKIDLKKSWMILSFANRFIYRPGPARAASPPMLPGVFVSWAWGSSLG